MGRGTITFAVAFLLLPLALLAGAWYASGGLSLLLVLLGLVVLATGFTMGLPMMEDSKG